MKHNFMFETKWNYTFDEVISSVIGQTGGASIPLNTNGATEVLQAISMLPSPSTANPWGLTFIEIEEGVASPSDLSITFLNKLYLRYRDHFAVQLDENLGVSSTEFFAFAKKFMIKVINKLDYTYLRYSTLLGMYEEQKSHLLDGLSRSRTGSREVSQEGENSEDGSYTDISNNTPQTSDIVATISENQYASDLQKGVNASSGSHSSSGTDEFEENETWDTKTLMEKLSEVEKNFVNVWENWLDNFDEVFVEEVNY